LALKWPFQWQKEGLWSKVFIEKTKAELAIHGPRGEELGGDVRHMSFESLPFSLWGGF